MPAYLSVPVSIGQWYPVFEKVYLAMDGNTRREWVAAAINNFKYFPVKTNAERRMSLGGKRVRVGVTRKTYMDVMRLSEIHGVTPGIILGHIVVAFLSKGSKILQVPADPWQTYRGE